MKIALLLIAAVANFAPSPLQALLGGRLGAWETVCYGAEAASLWIFVLITSWRDVKNREAKIACVFVALWGFWEAALRSGCRLMFPMDQLVRTQTNICEAATGWKFDSLSLALAGAAIALVAHECKPRS